MAKLGKDWGPLHPEVKKTETLAKTELSREGQLDLYRYMKLTRMTEDRLGNLYRQNKVVGGLYSSRGQEATSVGSAYALAPQDFVGPLIRNLGTMLVRGVKPREVMMQYMAKSDSPTGGKDCNTHFGDLERGLVAPISMLGAVIPVLAGVALAGRWQALCRLHRRRAPAASGHLRDLGARQGGVRRRELRPRGRGLGRGHDPHGALLQDEHHLAREEVDRLVLLHVVLQRELEAGLHVEELADVAVGVRPPQLVAPRLLDALRVLEGHVPVSL